MGPVLSLAMMWGTIATEVAIAYFLVSSVRTGRFGVWLSVCLHVLIIAMIGLWSFAIIMIGAVIAATGPKVLLRDLRLTPRASYDPAASNAEDANAGEGEAANERSMQSQN